LGEKYTQGIKFPNACLPQAGILDALFNLIISIFYLITYCHLDD